MSTCRLLPFLVASLAVLAGLGCGSSGGSSNPQPSVSAPVAGFTASPLAPVASQTVTFRDASTGSPTNWSWTFGDGGTSTTQSPTHAFTTTGTYTVTLTASNAGGTSSPATHAVSVTSGTATLTYPIVDSGQTKCYDATAEITAPAASSAFYGQDAQFAGRGPAYTLASDGKTVLDSVTGLRWMRGPNTTLASPVSSDKKTWSGAQAWVATVNTMAYGGYSDWRLPSIKELHSLVSYANAPDFNGKPALDTAFFTCTGITNENGDTDFPYYWTSTTHAGYSTAGSAGSQAVYIPFGRALGWPSTGWVDVHGAGCQRSDPKVGPPYGYATIHSVTKNGTTFTGYSFGPQGDAIRGLNFVRLVRDAP